MVQGVRGFGLFLLQHIAPLPSAGRSRTAMSYKRSYELLLGAATRNYWNSSYFRSKNRAN